jgi:hypothetical protein
MRHFTSIRREPLYSKALLTITYESNMGWDRAMACQRMLVESRMLEPMYVVSRDAKMERPGVWTDGVSKEQGKTLLVDTLAQRKLRYAANFITTETDEDRKMRATKVSYKHAIKADLEQQLRSYKKQVKAPADAIFGKTRYTYSGKAPGLRDDLCMALTQQLYIIRLLRSEPTFVELGEKHAHFVQ